MFGVDINLVSVSDNGLQIGAAAGRLSHNEGTAFEMFHAEDDFDKSSKRLAKIFNMGHSSIGEHLTFSFALDGLSLLSEQEIIGCQFLSPTVKSRRYVNHGETGFVLPDVESEYLYMFEEINVISGNAYQTLLENNIPKEDARFVLPYSTRSSMFLTGNLRAWVSFVKYCECAKHIHYELKDIASNINDKILEWVEDNYGISSQHLASIFDMDDKLLNIKNMSYTDIVQDIKNSERTPHANFKPRFMCQTKLNVPFQHPELDFFQLSTAPPRIVDHNISFAARQAVPRAIQLLTGERQNRSLTLHAMENSSGPFPDHSPDSVQYMLASYFPHDFMLVDDTFRFSIEWPLISLATLTHLTRHRLQDLYWTDLNMYAAKFHSFPPCFIMPKSIQKNVKMMNFYIDTMTTLFKLRQQIYIYKHLRRHLGYTLPAGEMVSAATNINLRSLSHFLNLRCCTRAQWEVRMGAEAIHTNLYNGGLLHAVVGKEPFTDAGISAFAKYIKHQAGPSCVTRGQCPEGSKGCGRPIPFNKPTLTHSQESVVRGRT